MTTEQATPTSALPFALDPLKTALIIMDIQPMIFARMPEGAASAVLNPITATLAAVRAAQGCTVAIVRVAFEASEFAAVPQTNKAFGKLSQISGGSAEKLGVLDGLPSVEVLDEVKPRAGELAIRKTRTGAFSTTDLHEKLQAKGVDTIILAGISTSGCVLSTVRDATDKDYRIIVMRDGTMDPKKEVHDILMNEVFEHSCYVANSRDIIEKLSS